MRKREPGQDHHIWSQLLHRANHALDIAFFNIVALDQQATRRAAGPAAALADAALPGWQHELAWLGELIEQRQPYSTVVHCLCTVP